MLRKCLVEGLGTFWLVMIGCGAAILAGKFIGFLGVAMAFGLAVLTMAYAVGHISGGHFNPAVSVGMWAAGRFKGKDLACYIPSQLIGGILGALVVFIIANSGPCFHVAKSFATNGYGPLSPGGFDLISCFTIEVMMTAFFVAIIGMVTGRDAQKPFAGLAIGLTLMAIHIVSIPVTNTSVNPARSTAVAIFDGTRAICQLWMFWLAPLIGGVLGGLFVRQMDKPETEKKAKKAK